jgi:putative chitinase
MTVITVAQLQALAPRCRAGDVAPALDAAAVRFGISGRLPVVHWLGQMVVESGGFTRLEENLNYSAERLMQVWPGRFPTISLAKPYERNSEALANKVYGGRLGNTAPGDGWRYRGGGWMQITGKDNYARIGKAIGLDLVARPELLRQPGPASDAAAAFWDEHDLNALAERDDVVEITRAINGGLNGLAERKAAVAHAKTLWT